MMKRCIPKIQLFKEEEEETREIERGYSESQRKPRPSGSGMGTPKRKNRVASMMGNSPKISTYFVKKEQGEGATKDMEMSKKSNIKNEKDAVKYEQEEGFARAMKMTPSMTFKHEKRAEKKEDLEVKNESGEYFEDYKEFDEQLKKEQSQNVTVDSPGDEVMEVETDLSYEEETKNMINPETNHVNEVQKEERENLNQPGVEVGTQAASEVAARSRPGNNSNPTGILVFRPKSYCKTSNWCQTQKIYQN